MLKFGALLAEGVSVTSWPSHSSPYPSSVPTDRGDVLRDYVCLYDVGQLIVYLQQEKNTSLYIYLYVYLYSKLEEQNELPSKEVSVTRNSFCLGMIAIVFMYPRCPNKAIFIGSNLRAIPSPHELQETNDRKNKVFYYSPCIILA
ncbi:hypothetical protein F4703DRAFT_1918256 [Phycomyces blakesleeanus]